MTWVRVILFLVVGAASMAAEEPLPGVQAFLEKPAAPLLFATRDGVTWDELEQKHRAALHDAAHAFVFRFTNNRSTALRPKRVEASCGCTDTDYSTNLVAPGASGTITFHFNFGTSAGLLHKNAMVSFQDAAGQEFGDVTLNFFVDVPRLIAESDERKTWTLSEYQATQSQRLSVSALKGLDIASLSLTSEDRKMFRASLQDWTIALTPTKDLGEWHEETKAEFFDVEAQFTDGAKRSFRVWAMIIPDMKRK